LEQKKKRTAAAANEAYVLNLAPHTLPNGDTTPFPCERPQRSLHLNRIPDDKLTEPKRHLATRREHGIRVIHPVDSNIQSQSRDLEGRRVLDEEIDNPVFVSLRNGCVRSLHQLPSRLPPETDEDVLTHGQSKRLIRVVKVESEHKGIVRGCSDLAEPGCLPLCPMQERLVDLRKGPNT
jgi:hypothetical protein